MSQFHDETAQESVTNPISNIITNIVTINKEILIFDCVFGEKAHDCRGGEIDGIYYSLWEPVTTFFGKCLRFSTENLQFIYPKGKGRHTWIYFY